MIVWSIPPQFIPKLCSILIANETNSFGFNLISAMDAIINKLLITNALLLDKPEATGISASINILIVYLKRLTFYLSINNLIDALKNFSDNIELSL